jgi:hypothetical protein
MGSGPWPANWATFRPVRLPAPARFPIFRTAALLVRTVTTGDCGEPGKRCWHGGLSRLDMSNHASARMPADTRTAHGARRRPCCPARVNVARQGQSNLIPRHTGHLRHPCRAPVHRQGAVVLRARRIPQLSTRGVCVRSSQIERAGRSQGVPELLGCALSAEVFHDSTGN